MKIRDDHKYHGAALIQVAEHELFTAINSLKLGEKVFQNAYKINDEIALFLKYARNENEAFGEFVFTYSTHQLDELLEVRDGNVKTYVAMICVAAREICCISCDELVDMIDKRKKIKGAGEDQYNLLVTAPIGKSLRIYLNEPGKKNAKLEEKIVSRKDFPERLFA